MSLDKKKWENLAWKVRNKIIVMEKEGMKIKLIGKWKFDSYSIYDANLPVTVYI